MRIDGTRWTAVEAVAIDARACAAGDSGAIGTGVVFAFGGYRVGVSLAPAGTQPSPPQRTESLARELVRSLLGSGAAPSLEITRGAGAGSKRVLPPPEATFVIGRGDDATWVILDEDLSSTHVEIRRGWDGITIRDLGSKNGTRVAGAKITRETALHDGDTIEMANVTILFCDSAERHLRGTGAALASSSPVRDGAGAARVTVPPSAWPGLFAAAVAVVAIVGLIWILATT